MIWYLKAATKEAKRETIKKKQGREVEKKQVNANYIKSTEPAKPNKPPSQPGPNATLSASRLPRNDRTTRAML
jgi:hypothetical protein